MSTPQNLFGSDFAQADAPPPTMSKKGFGEHIGLSPARITQLIAQGLPVEPNGRIDVAKGKAWYAANVDSNRARAANGPEATQAAASGLLTPRAQRDQHEAEIAALKAARLAGRHVDRKATLRVIEARAKYERDAWIGWVNRVAPALAATVGGDVSAVTAFLDREVREQLGTLASNSIEVPR